MVGTTEGTGGAALVDMQLKSWVYIYIFFNLVNYIYANRIGWDKIIQINKVIVRHDNLIYNHAQSYPIRK